MLDVEGAVAGTQFDRFGALWLGEVPLLRLTTPEPEHATEPTRWRVERDVTALGPLFLASAEAALAVPNVVDETYTGAINLTATLSFYPPPPPPPPTTWQASLTSADAPSTPEPAATAAAAHHLVLPLRRGDGGHPLQRLRVAGDANLTRSVALPRRDYTSATVEVHATPHGECEEFWYASQPDELGGGGGAVDDNSGAAECGGGPYRQLELRIDGVVAGAQLPLPVVYTGGICPALWRPLAAPHALSVPPYTFDVTPFVGLLNDGRPHAFTLSVASGGRHGSYWYIDATLVARSDGSGRAYGGRLLAHSEAPAVAPRRTDGGAGEARGAAAGADALALRVAATYGYEVVGELTLPAAKTGATRARRRHRARPPPRQRRQLAVGRGGRHGGHAELVARVVVERRRRRGVRASRGGATPPARRRSDSPRPTAATPTPI